MMTELIMMHQQSYNLLVHFSPLFDFLPEFGKLEAGKAEKLLIYVHMYYIIKVHMTSRR